MKIIFLMLEQKQNTAEQCLVCKRLTVAGMFSDNQHLTRFPSRFSGHSCGGWKRRLIARALHTLSPEPEVYPATAETARLREGGGAGGRVYVHFTSGDFKSGHVSAHGRF